MRGRAKSHDPRRTESTSPTAPARLRLSQSITLGGSVMQPRALTEWEERMCKDFAWAKHAPEVQQNPEHFGKLVVVYEKQVLAVGRDRHAIMAQAAMRTGVPAE